ncbi:MAG: hypothetical protein KKE96_04690 [Candidatus Altiarchaeota archaeon]|nr:hypothetical protein [Candidatus Altiarchaeota archaeon]MBU4406734.1 hypothetical protein [Candidatus Altiarchaeota archaeon]
MRLQIKKILPRGWEYKEDNEYIKIWYKNEKGRHPEPIKVKNEIEISRELGVLLGFWIGDGTKRRFVLTNNEPILIKYLYDSIRNIFSVDEDNLSLRISIPPNFKRKEIQFFDSVNEQFHEISDIKTKGFYANRNSPILHLRINSIVFIKLFKQIYAHISQNVSKESEIWDGYLTGIIAAEGHMDLRRNYNTLSRIAIAQVDKDNREEICKALEKKGITYTTSEGYITIFGKKNFDIISKRELYSLHPKKKEQFIKGYSRIKQAQYSTDEVEHLLLDNMKEPIRVSKLAKKFGRCRQTIREHLLLKGNSLYKRGLIEVRGKERGARGSFYGNLWGLTEKGFNHIQSTEVMEK